LKDNAGDRTFHTETAFLIAELSSFGSERSLRSEAPFCLSFFLKKAYLHGQSPPDVFLSQHRKSARNIRNSSLAR